MHDYLSGCSQQVFEAFVPPCLLNMQSFRAMALLLYREFRTPIVGIRTMNEIIRVYPVDEMIANVPFQSVYFIGKSREQIAKIEKLTPAVFSRHPDIHQHIAVDNGKSSRRVGLLNVIEGKVPLRKFSVVLSSTARRSMPRIFRISENASLGTARASGKHFGTEKVTPIRDGECAGSSNSIEDAKHRHSNVSFHDVPDSKPRLSNQINEDEDVDGGGDSKKPHSPTPVIALSPQELIKKATSPPSNLNSSREPIMRPLSSRTPRSAREPEDVLKVDSRHLDPAPGSARPKLAPIAALTESPTNNPTASKVGPPVEAIRRISQSSPSGSRRQSWQAASAFQRTSAIVAAKMSAMRLRQESTQNLVVPDGFPPVDLANHFVVCGTPTSYSEFLSNLSDLDEKPSAVVFVTPRQLSERDVDASEQHRDIYFVHGSPLSMEVYHAARMFCARSILIMSHCGDEFEDEKDDEDEQTDENMEDVDAITTHRFVSEAIQLERLEAQLSARDVVSNNPFVVVEMIRPSNVKFLTDRSCSRYDSKTVGHAQHARELSKEARCLDSSLLSPLYASGHVFFSNLMDALLGAGGQEPLVANLLIQLITSGNMSLQNADHELRSRHRLSQIPVPQRYHFRPYALMVEAYLLSEVRCLSLQSLG